MTLPPYFIDTSGFVGLFSANDSFHPIADTFFSKEQCGKLYTSDLVLFELITLLRCKEKCSTSEIQKIYDEITRSEIVVLGYSEEDKKSAMKLLGQYTDHYLSFTDCLSFVLMKQNKIQHALSSDKHFDALGFVRYGV